MSTEQDHIKIQTAFHTSTLSSVIKTELDRKVMIKNIPFFNSVQKVPHRPQRHI